LYSFTSPFHPFLNAVSHTWVDVVEINCHCYELRSPAVCPPRLSAAAGTNGVRWKEKSAAGRAGRAFQAVTLGFQSPVARDFHRFYSI
jgi:hypothetical protein